MRFIARPPSSPVRGMLEAAVLPVLIAGCGDSRAASTPPVDDPRPVRIATLSDTSVSASVSAAGTLGSHDEIALSFKTGGVIAGIGVAEGDRVRAGQVLARLELQEIDAAVSKTRAAVDKARRDLARLERLAADSVATAVQVQDARTVLTVAQADLEATGFNRTRSVITSPAAGTILRRHARPGEQVGAGAVVLTLASDASGTVFRVAVPDRDRVRLERGDSAEVRLDAYPGRTFPGVVREVGAAPLPNTGTYPVEVDLKGAASLPRGLVGRARLAGRESQRVSLVPVEAVLEADAGRAALFALVETGPDQPKVERRQVTIAFVRGGMVGVAAGLDGVRAVVTDGAPYLNDGDRVRVIP